MRSSLEESLVASRPPRHVPHPLYEQLAHRHREFGEELRFEGEAFG
jgi:hypothetical protein